MKKIVLSMIGVLVLFCAFVTVSEADIVDDFDSYSTGALSTVSGGMWRTWANSGTDAQVVAEGTSSPNAIAFGTTFEDVVTYNAGNLLAGGTATFSADFLVKSGNTRMALAFQLGSGNPADNSINYASSITNIVIGYGATGSEVHNWNPNTGAFPMLVTVTCDVWHNLTLEAYQTGSSSFFDIFVDGALVADNYNFTTAFTDINGFNAIEIYSGYVGGSSEPASGNGYLVDNISLTGSTVAAPEPASILLLGLGLMGLAGIRKRFNN